MMTRRAILMSGGAAVLVTGVGVSAVVNGPGLAPARAPWAAAGQGFKDPRLTALSYAILAPNPHNRQPWWFALRDDGNLDVFCDLERLLPETDPFERQITIGFGCMLEILRLAAAEQGVRAEISAFPDGEPGPNLDQRRIAHVAFRTDPDVVRDPLFAHVLERRSSKDPFDTTRPVSRDVCDTLIAAGRSGLEIGGTIDTAQTQRLIDLTMQGFLVEYRTPHTRYESIELMRIGNREVVDNPDGIDMGGFSMGLFKLLGIVTRKSLDTEGTQAFETGERMYHDVIHSAQGFVWIKADTSDRAAQLKAGQDWLRMNLAAQSLGLGIHPLSQVLQEYPEMAELYQATRDELAVDGDGVIHMLGRIGYGDMPSASPRWPLETRLIEASA